MDMKLAAASYFEAFRDKDIDKLKKLLASAFGIRTFMGKLIFKYDDLEDLFSSYTLKAFGITDMLVSNNTVYFDSKIEYMKDSKIYNESLVSKIVFKNDLIVRVFETIKNEGYTRIKCTVSYDGSSYAGFQRQPNEKTVQGDIEKALWYLTKEEITIHSSGRTDKGVHALKQVFHFDTLSKINPLDFARVLKSYLPSSIYVLDSTEVHPTFHSRYDSYSKEYEYKLKIGAYDPIQRNYEWNVNGVDVAILKRELYSIVGTHDFTSFTKTKEDKNMIRTIFDVKVTQKGEYIYISIVGSGFLHYMVRYLVGTSVEIAKGNIQESLLNFIEYKNSSKVKWKAPSNGLYLKGVVYKE